MGDDMFPEGYDSLMGDDQIYLFLFNLFDFGEN